MTIRSLAPAFLAVAIFCLLSRGPAAQTPRTPPPAPTTVAVTIDVIATTPLPGVNLTLDEIPSPAQSAGTRDIEESGAQSDVDLTRLLSVDLDVVGASGSFARGNENNQHRPDGMVYLGPGRAPGYGVANLGVADFPVP